MTMEQPVTTQCFPFLGHEPDRPKAKGNSQLDEAFSLKRLRQVLPVVRFKHLFPGVEEYSRL